MTDTTHLPVCLEPSIDFIRPAATMSEQWCRNGAACRDMCQSASKSNQVGPRLWRCAQPVHQVPRPRRVRDDRVDLAVVVEREGILIVADVARIGAAQSKGFQMPDQRALTSARLSKGFDAAQVRGTTAARGVGYKSASRCSKLDCFAHLLPALPASGRRGFANTHPTAGIAEIAEMVVGLNFRISRNFRFREGL
jgi:hypothetical protein